METINFLKKTYEIKEKLGESFSLIEFKGKKCVIKSFSSVEEFNSFFSIYKRLKLAGVSIPKLIKKDKKEFKFLFLFVEGKTILDLLVEGELSKEIYSQVFTQSYYAKNERIFLDYRPDKWRFDGKNLYYLGFYFKDDKEKKLNFHEDGIEYWVYSKEFQEYLRVLGKEIDQTRVKQVYEINKQIVQLVCLYHI